MIDQVTLTELRRGYAQSCLLAVMHQADNERAAPASMTGHRVDAACVGTARWCIDAAGWLQPAAHRPSPNCNERPAGCDIELLVVHNISLPAGRFGGGHIEALFANCLDCSVDPSFAGLAGLEVSAHLLIDRAGAVTQFVGFEQRAWHAGVSHFAGRENCNDFSIGIELEGTDLLPYTDAQYQSLAAVTRLLMQRYPALAAQRIVGHSDIAPGRKTDPGPAFDWEYLRSLLDAANPAPS